MRLDIIATEQLSDEQSLELRALSEAVYPPKPQVDESASAKKWEQPQWRIMIRDDDQQLVSHIGVLSRTCLCDSKEILIGGIGGVETHPSKRRRGYAGVGLRRAIEFMQSDLRVDMALLFCGPKMLIYYGRFGFINFVGDTYVRQDSEQILVPRSEVMVRPALKPLPQCAVLDLCGLPW